MISTTRTAVVSAVALAASLAVSAMTSSDPVTWAPGPNTAPAAGAQDGDPHEHRAQPAAPR